MISWIVATHDRAVLEANLLATLEPNIYGDDEIILAEDAPSIAVAYNRGTAIASRPVRCYVHQDVRVLDVVRLRHQLLNACTAGTGMVGVVGSLDVRMPWWSGRRCGSVIDARLGRLDFGPGGHPCALLDGLLLATSQPLEWDEGYPGWHGYDHDICRQQLARGLGNWCLPAGAELCCHNTSGPTDLARVDGWAAAAATYREKWG